MIWKLLRRNVSVAQIAGYAIANFIGLAIVMSAIRFYGDVSSALSDDGETNPLISADYMVLSKPVSMLGTLLGSNVDFGPDEIDELQAQPWATAVGAFTSADFSVGASLEMGGRGISTYMFMESLPDEFVDVNTRQWHFDSSHGTSSEIPLILSREYLALYNFGFAASRGLPQLSEDLISKIPIKLTVSGNGHMDTYTARIVGLSSRLNTIAVPQSFMEWANGYYAHGHTANPSRLIVKVSNPGDPAVESYVKGHGYEVAGERSGNDRMSYFLTVLTSVVVSVGAIISALALFILILSILLLLQKNREKISSLLLLGYTPLQVAAGYYRLIGIVNAGVLVAAVIAMLVASGMWQSQLSSLSLCPSSPLTAILWGTAIMALITLLNVAIIYRMVRNNY